MYLPKEIWNHILNLCRSLKVVNHFIAVCKYFNDNLFLLKYFSEKYLSKIKTSKENNCKSVDVDIFKDCINFKQSN